MSDGTDITCIATKGETTGKATTAASEQADGESVRLRALVVSDLHAVTGPSGTRESWADMSEPNNPLAALPRLLGNPDDPVEADVVLCPGDLGHKADPAATDWAWEQVQKIAAAAGAELVIATAGNHDVDSRHRGASLDPRSKLKALQPGFPLLPDPKANEYWAHSISVMTHAGWRIVTLDSCFHHAAKPDEHEQGRIEATALDYLERQLVATDDSARVNVLLCHHHPMPHTELDPADRSMMQGGDRLIDVLDRDRHGRWLIVHGHKHFPWLRYAGGSSISPVLFSAGSASVSLYSPLNTRVRNQIHLIDFETSRSDSAHLHLAGRFRSWTWASGSGWMASASRTDGLPGRGGFGYRADPVDVAQQIYDQHLHAGRKTLRHEDLLAADPRLEYLAPLDLECLKQTLRRDHGVRMRLYDDGTISETTAP